MSYTNLKPGTRGLLRAFRALKGNLTKYKTVKTPLGETVTGRYINAIQKRNQINKEIRRSRATEGRTTAKKRVLKQAAVYRGFKGLRGTP